MSSKTSKPLSEGQWSVGRVVFVFSETTITWTETRKFVRFTYFYWRVRVIHILVGGLEHVFFPYIRNNHPNWLISFKGVETTNQEGLESYIYQFIWKVCRVQSWLHRITPDGIPWLYTLVIYQIGMENHHSGSNAHQNMASWPNSMPKWNYQRLNPIKSHETTIFLWFSSGFPSYIPWYLNISTIFHVILMGRGRILLLVYQHCDDPASTVQIYTVSWNIPLRL